MAGSLFFAHQVAKKMLALYISAIGNLRKFTFLYISNITLHLQFLVVRNDSALVAASHTTTMPPISTCAELHHFDTYCRNVDKIQMKCTNSLHTWFETCDANILFWRLGCGAHGGETHPCKWISQQYSADGQMAARA